MRTDEPRRLAEQRASLLADAAKLNDKALEEKRSFTAEEQQEFDRMMNEADELTEQRNRCLQILKEQQINEAALTTPIEQQMGIEPINDAESYGQYMERRSGTRYEDSSEHRNAFWHYIGAKSVSDLDVEEHRALSKGTATAGGYLVPTGFYNQLIRALRDMGNIAQYANTLTTDSGETIPVAANTAHGTASWTAEGIAYTPSDETFAQVNLSAYKSTAKTIVSEELLEDSSFDLQTFLVNEFGERLGVLQNTAFVKGDGSGKPQGILSSNTASNVTTVTAAAGAGNVTTFGYDALVSAIFSLPRQYRANARFIVSDTSARNLYLLKDTTGRPIWAPNPAEGGPDTLLGYPITTDPDLPAPAAGNISLLFGDFQRGYMIRRVRGVGVQRQNELHSDNGQVGFRVYERVDGRVVLASAIIAVAHAAT